MTYSRILKALPPVLALFLFLVFLRGGFLPFPIYSTPESEYGADLLGDEAIAAFMRGDYRLASTLLEARIDHETDPEKRFDDRRVHITSLVRLGEYGLAEQILDTLIAGLAGSDSLLSRYAWARCSRAEVLIRTARFDPASEELLECAAANTRSTGQRDVVEAYFGHLMGFLYHSRGQYANAISMFKQTLEKKSRLYGVFSEEYASTLNILANSYYRLGNYPISLELHTQVLDIRRAVAGASHPSVAGSLGNLGNVYHAQGDDGRALTHHERAIDIWIRSSKGKSVDLAFSRHNAGIARMALGQYEEALSQFERSLALKRELLGGLHPSTSWTLMKLAEVYIQLGHLQKADNASLEGLRILNTHALQEHVRYWEALRTRAHVEAELGQFDVASETLGRAVSYARDNEHPFVIPFTNDLAEIQLKSGLHQLALQTVNRLLDLESSSDDPAVILLTGDFSRSHYLKEHARSLFLKSQALFLIGRQPDEAFDLLSRAAEVIETLQTQTSNANTLQQLIKIERELLALGLNQALSMQDHPETQAHQEVLFEFIERRNNNSLYHNLLKAQFIENVGVPYAVRDSTLILYDAVVQLERRLDIAGAAPVPGSTEAASIKSDLFEAQSRLEHYEQSIRDAYPALAAFPGRVRYSTLTQVQTYLARTNHVLVTFVETGDSMAGVAVRSDSVYVYHVEDAQSLNPLVFQLTHGIKSRVSSEFVSAARSLYRLLIEPLEQFMGDLDVMIIPEGPVGGIPFEALLTEDTSMSQTDFRYHELQYLIGERAVSYAYSASLMMHHGAHNSPSVDKRILAIAPVFDWEFELPHDTHEFLEMNGKSNTSASGLSSLPGTEQEVTSIARLTSRRQGYGFGAGTTLLRRKATESAVKAELLKGHGFLHFATHSFANTRNPRFSGIVLAPGDRSEDGVLYPSEILGLDLNAELVVLSSCETGLGTGTAGLNSFSESFVNAGARNLVVSLWPTDDQGTTELMTVFYRHLANGISIQRSLRLAKLELIRRGDIIAKPYFWAGFVHVGAPPSTR